MASIRPKTPARDQVVELDAVGQPRPDALGVVLDQRQVVFDELVAELAAGIFFELLPDFGDIFGRGLPSGSGDNRCHAILRDASRTAGCATR